MIVPRYYENLNVLHENTMPARAYYIPASKRMDNLVEHREESDRMQLLNGTWKFQYFTSIYNIKDSFFEKNYDTENFDEIQVPSVWQMAGYDTHQYTNIRYPFPFDPPYVPQDIPCGAYVHNFEYSRDEKASKAFLNFEGVDSCFYVWINGCNGVQREHNKKLNNGLPILHKVPPKRDYGRYFCIMAEKGGTSHGGLTEKLSPFFHAKKQEVNAYGR